jgi:hypothetical protein
MGMEAVFMTDVHDRREGAEPGIGGKRYAAYFKRADAAVVNCTSLFTCDTVSYTMRRVSAVEDIHWKAWQVL